MQVRSVSNANLISSRSHSKNISMGEAPANTAASSSVSTTAKKSNKNTIIGVSTAVVLAGLGIGYAIKKRKSPKAIIEGLTHNGVKLGDRVVQEKISTVRFNNADEVGRIIKENTGYGMLDLNKMDEAAKMRSCDTNRPDFLHEAANIIEESYKIAYQKAKPEEGKNMLDKIANRIDNESKQLVDIYAQMPYNEALERAKSFSDDVIQMDNRAGMSAKDFFKKLTGFIDERKKG